MLLETERAFRHAEEQMNTTGGKRSGMEELQGEPPDAEQRLRESEAMARALLDVPYAASFLIDAAGTILDANETLARRFNTSRAALVGTPLWDLFTPEVERAAEDLPGAGRGREAGHSLRGPARGNVERLHRLAHPRRRRGRLAGSPSSPLTSRNASARKHAWRESEEEYRQLVETANSVILSWDTAGTILFINEFGERYFGFSKDELVGRNVVGTIVPEPEARAGTSRS